ncbi:MAG TPA: DoxX family protein [Pyrinomonadaceae bacterium]|nr:DoxX family protein [Pyrinomonadaceae bacterium]
MSHIPGFRLFENYREYGAVFVRLVVAFVLVYGTQDNVFSHERMLEFRDFLAARRVPFPLFAAHLSAYAQFLCGILFALGLFVRPAALLMVINFVAALLIAHLDTPLDAARLALCMLFSSLFLLFNGAGALSLDSYLERRGGGV